MVVIDLNEVLNEDYDGYNPELGINGDSNSVIDDNDGSRFDLNQSFDHDATEEVRHQDNDEFVVNAGKKFWKPLCADNVKPFVSQKFKTLDQAFIFYKEYGRNGGFDVRRSTTKKHWDNSVYLKYIVCSKSGWYEKISNQWVDNESDMLESTESDKKRRRTTSSKCGCNAKIVLKSIGLSGFTISIFEEYHNHELATESGKQFLRCSRVMTTNHMQFVFDSAKANIGGQRAHNILSTVTGSYAEVGATATDFKNFARDLKKYIGKHDADMILHKFQDKYETSEKGFVYEYETDSNGHLSRIFWAQPYGRRSYEVFGDVVSFDATYRTNRYNMIFVPFIGLDNHWKSVTFAAALLSKEDIANFEWVFDVFLKVMGRSPNCIVTDQCPAMRAAIRIKFPGSAHRLCMWHIMKKFPSKIGTLFYLDSPFMKKINKFVWSDHASPEEFEDGWKSVMKEFGLENHKWLSEMYELRRYWIPAYFTEDAMAGLLRTTSRSESSNFYFNHFVQKGDTLVEFYLCYESAIERQLYINSRLNHKDSSMPKLVTTKKIERDAAEQYTHAIFFKVQEEIKAGCYDMELESVNRNEQAKVFFVKDHLVKNKLLQVHVDLTTTNVECSCKLFTRVGYLCSHAFFCLGLCGINKIPREQLSNRWLKNAEARYSTMQLGELSDHCKTRQKVRSIRADGWFEFQGCMTEAGNDVDMLEFVRDVAKEARRKLIDRKQNKSVLLRSEVIADIIGMTCSEDVTIFPPLQSNNKGSRKRIVGGAEKNGAGNRTKKTCKSCDKVVYHDSRTCPKRKKN